MKFNAVCLIKALFVSLLFVMATTSVIAQESVSGSGGTLVAPTVVGSTITVSGVATANGGTARLACVVTSYTSSTYQLTWQCDRGSLNVDGVLTATVSGSMKMQCQGGGRAGKITCWHTFAGIALDPDGTSGAVTASAKAATAYATATVTAFSATW